MPRFAEAVEGARKPRKSAQTTPPSTVLVTVLAQDPEVAVDGAPQTVALPVLRTRLQRGPANYRFHVVDVRATDVNAEEPVQLHADDWPWENEVAGMPALRDSRPR